MTRTISLVTGNPKKFHEIAANISSHMHLEQVAIDLIEPQVLSLREISAYKAKQAFELLKKPVIVEDTGTFFDAYTHFPGVFTKFVYQQLGIPGLKALLQENNTGKFITILSYMDETTPEPLQFIGEIHGKFGFDHIVGEIDTHMPYNHIFYPESSEAPAIDIYDQWKANNHRQRAVKNFNKRVEEILLKRESESL